MLIQHFQHLFTYDMHCTCCVSPATNTVYHLCTYSLELLCSCSHAGMDTLTWLNIWWRVVGVMLELRATMVPHRYTVLASKFLLVVLSFNCNFPGHQDSLQLSCHNMTWKLVIPYMFTKSGLANCVS